MILEGELQPGEKLVQETLSRRMGVSRTPLLHALTRLEEQMLVESFPNRGMYVKKFSAEEMRDAFQCRVAVEGLAARLTAQSAKENELNELDAVFAAFRKQPERADYHAYLRADQQFHRRILELSGNRILWRLELALNVWHLAYLNGLVRPPVETLPDHEAILKALRERDPDAAETAMRRHLEASLAILENRLRKEVQAS